MLRARITPCLLVHNGGLVKTVRFKEPKYVGDPINAVDGDPHEVLLKIPLTPQLEVAEVGREAGCVREDGGICQDQYKVVAVRFLLGRVDPPTSKY